MRNGDPHPQTPSRPARSTCAQPRKRLAVGVAGRDVAGRPHIILAARYDSRLTERPASRIADEVTSTRQAIAAAAPGAPVPYFRQPTMFVTDEVGAVTYALGYQRLNWTLDTKDWTKPGADAIVRSVVQQLRPGAVILLHDGGDDRAGTVAALPPILDVITAAGLGVGLPG